MLGSRPIQVRVTSGLPRNVRTRCVPGRHAICIHGNVSRGAAFRTIGQRLTYTTLSRRSKGCIEGGIGTRTCYTTCMVNGQCKTRISNFRFKGMTRVRTGKRGSPRRLHNFLGSIHRTTCAVHGRVRQGFKRRRRAFSGSSFSFRRPPGRAPGGRGGRGRPRQWILRGIPLLK